MGVAEAPRFEGRAVQPFSWWDLSGELVSSRGLRGRRSLVAFVTTYDLPSQVLARWLVERVRTEVPRVNALLVILEPPDHRPLAEAFASSLAMPFPVVMADAATLDGHGAFGAVESVPTLVILDSGGAEVWRRSGALSLDQALTRLRALP